MLLPLNSNMIANMRGDRLNNNEVICSTITKRGGGTYTYTKHSFNKTTKQQNERYVQRNSIMWVYIQVNRSK